MRLGSAVWGVLLWGTASAAADGGKLDALGVAAKQSPHDLAASVLLGRALRSAGRFAEASKELRRGIAASSGATVEEAAGARYELARVLIDQGKFRDALVACKAVGASGVGDALAHVCTARAHMIQKRATEALPEIDLALQASPGLYEAKVVQGQALALEGSLAEAEQAERDAIAKEPGRPEAYLRLGDLLAVGGKRELALEAFEKARGADPEDVDAAFAVGRALAPGQAAADALAQAVERRPTFGPAWARLADVRLALGQLAEAEKAAARALEIDPKQAEWHGTMARIYAAEKRSDDALAEAKKALALVGNLASAKLVEADVLAEKGEIDLALETYQTAFGYSRTDPTALVHAASACLAAGRDTTAKGFADRVTQLFPKWGPGWVVLGDVLVRWKDKVGARQAYDTALLGEGPVDSQVVHKKLAALR